MIPSLFAHAKVEIRNSNYQSAINDLNQVILSEPKNAVAYNLRADCYYQIYEFNEAIKDITRALQNDPNNANYHNSLGVYYYGMGKATKALESATRSISLGLGNNFRRVYYCFFSRGGGYYYINRGLEYLNRGKYRFSLGMVSEASQDFVASLQMSSDERLTSIVCFSKGLLAYFTDNSNALEYFDQSINSYKYPRWQFGIGGLLAFRAFMQKSKDDAKKALQRFNVKKEKPRFWACVYQGIAKIVLEQYYEAISDFDQALSLSTEVGWIYYFRAQAKYLINDYEGALCNYVQALKKFSFSPVIRIAFEILIKTINSGGNNNILVNFRDSENLQTLLHLACTEDYGDSVKILTDVKIFANKLPAIEPVGNSQVGGDKSSIVKTEKNRYPNIIEYILSRDSQNKTALMLALDNKHVNLPLLIFPLLRGRMGIASYVASNVAILQPKQMKSDSTAPIASTVSQPPPLLIAQDYRAKGLSTENVRQIQEVFEDTRFPSIMEDCQKRINDCGNEDKRKLLRDEAVQLACVKYRYDVEHAENLETAVCKFTETQDKFSTIINILYGVFNFNIVRRLEKYAPYLNGLISILELLHILTKSDSNSISDELNSFVNSHRSNSKYVDLLVPGLKLFFAFKDKKYDSVFCQVIAFYKIWAEQFGSENEKIIALRLNDLMKEFYIQSEKESDWVAKISFLSQGLTPASRCAMKIIRCQATIAKSMSTIKSYVDSNQIEEARRQFRCLIYNLLLVTKCYSESSDLQKVVSDVTKALNMRDISNCKDYAQYGPIVDIFKKIYQQRPNDKLEAVVAILDNFLKDFNNQSIPRFFIFLRLLSRLFIDYGNVSGNVTFSYVGIFCLVISQTYFVVNKIKHEETVLNKANLVTHEVETFLEEIGRTLKSPLVYRITAGVITVNVLLDVCKELMELSEVDADKVLNILRPNVKKGNDRIANIVRCNCNDKVLKIVKECFDVTEDVITVGTGISLVYSLLTGSIFQRLKSNLDKICPGSSNVVLMASRLIPGVGAIISDLDLNSVKKALEDRVGQVDQHLFEVHKDLATKIEAIAGVIEHKMNIICGQLSAIKEMIVDFNVKRPIGSLIKDVDIPILAFHQNGERINEEVVKNYNKFLKYLLPGKTVNQALSSVYSIHCPDALMNLREQLIKSGKWDKQVPIPNFRLWSDLILGLLRFVPVIDVNCLFESSSFIFNPLQELFARANDVLTLLDLLNTKEVMDVFFKNVLDPEVNLERLRELVAYCSLVEIPLVGYGEDVGLWTDNTKNGLVWRQAMAETASKLVTVTNINKNCVVIATTYQIVYTLGCTIIGLIEQYGKYLHKSNSKKRNFAEPKKIAEEIFVAMSSLVKAYTERGNLSAGLSMEKLMKVPERKIKKIRNLAQNIFGIDSVSNERQLLSIETTNHNDAKPTTAPSPIPTPSFTASTSPTAPISIFLPIPSNPAPSNNILADDLTTAPQLILKSQVCYLPDLLDVLKKYADSVAQREINAEVSAKSKLLELRNQLHVEIVVQKFIKNTIDALYDSVHGYSSDNAYQNTRLVAHSKMQDKQKYEVFRKLFFEFVEKAKSKCDMVACIRLGHDDMIYELIKEGFKAVYNDLDRGANDDQITILRTNVAISLIVQDNSDEQNRSNAKQPDRLSWVGELKEYNKISNVNKLLTCLDINQFWEMICIQKWNVGVSIQCKDAQQKDSSKIRILPAKSINEKDAVTQELSEMVKTADQVYVPINLGNHWVVYGMNKTDKKLHMYYNPSKHNGWACGYQCLMWILSRINNENGNSLSGIVKQEYQAALKEGLVKWQENENSKDADESLLKKVRNCVVKPLLDMGVARKLISDIQRDTVCGSLGISQSSTSIASSSATIPTSAQNSALAKSMGAMLSGTGNSSTSSNVGSNSSSLSSSSSTN